MKIAIKILILNLLFIYSCNTKRNYDEFLFSNSIVCLEYGDSISLSKMVKSMSYFWKKDSLANNFVRKQFVSNISSTQKIKYDIGYDEMLEAFGPGYRKYPYPLPDDEGVIKLTYAILDSEEISEGVFKEINTLWTITFIFDRKNKRLIKIK